MVYKRFPRLEERKNQMAGTSERWRAADAGNGTGAYVKTED